MRDKICRFKFFVSKNKFLANKSLIDTSPYLIKSLILINIGAAINLYVAIRSEPRIITIAYARGVRYHNKILVPYYVTNWT